MVHALLIASLSIVGFLAAYFIYGKFIATKILELDPNNLTPAHIKNDGQEFVPTNKFVLFGHHFASIAGLGPILGPAIAVIWGWLPALLWVFFGTIFLGAVQDLTALAISMRFEGRSLGEITSDLIGKRAQRLFLLVIFFTLSLAMGVFALVIAILFTEFHPQAIIPTFSLIFIAVIIGILVYKLNLNLTIATIIGLIAIFGALFVGIEYPLSFYGPFTNANTLEKISQTQAQGTFDKYCYILDFGNSKLDPSLALSEKIYPLEKVISSNKILNQNKDIPVTWQAFSPHNIRTMLNFFQATEDKIIVADLQQALGKSREAWIWGLLLYALIASILPVWLLLQPRDYLNSFQLYIGCALMYLGLVVGMPLVVAPAFNPQAYFFLPHPTSGIPGLFPFLFITIACGAISGFHCLVSSGTTVRQIKNEKDALFIGYGGMLMEGALAVGVILACTAGFSSQESWNYFYQSWSSANGLGAKLAAFVNGAGYFISNLGIPLLYGKTLIAVLVVGFAMTTLDSATRLLRYNVEEIGRNMGIKPFCNKYFATVIAVLMIAFFALMKIDGKPAGLTLWALFGTSNQLLGGVGLLLATIYLYKKGKPIRYTLLPMIFMLSMTLIAMVIKEIEFWRKGEWSLVVVGGSVLFMALWLCLEAILTVRKLRKE